MRKSTFAHVKKLLLISTVLVLTACASSPQPSSQGNNIEAQPSRLESINNSPPEKPLPRQMIENLFLADILAFRGQHQQAAELTMETAKAFNEPSLAEESMWHLQQSGSDLKPALSYWASWDNSSDAYLVSNARYELSKQNFGETLRYASQIKEPSLANPFFQSVGATAMRWPADNQDRFVEVLKAVQAARPDLSAVTIAIALTHFYRFPEQSIELMEQLLTEFPNDEAVVANTAGLMAEVGDIDKALAVLDKFLEQHQSVDIQTQRLKTEYFDNRREPNFRPLLDTPDITVAWLVETANWLTAQGFFTQATEFSAHLAKRPALLERAALIDAEILIAQGNQGAALGLLMQIKQPEHVTVAAESFARMELSSDNLTVIEQWYDERRIENPSYSEQWIQLELRDLCGREEMAVCRARAASILETNPHSFSALEVLSEILTRSGQQTQLEQYYEQFLSYNPDAHLIRNNLAYGWISREVRLDEAEQQLQIALSAEPENPAYLDSLGWLYYLQGNLTLAYEYVSRASQLVDHPEILAHLITILEAMSNQAQADEVRSFARERFPTITWSTER